MRLKALIISVLALGAIAPAAHADGRLVPAGCLDGGGGACTAGKDLAGAAGVALSPDGRQAYAVSSSDSALTIFDRDAHSGTLTQRSQCFRYDGLAGCSTGLGLHGATGIAVSPDGTSLYVASTTGDLAIFARAADGSLTQSSPPAACHGTGGCTPALGLGGARAVIVSPDGANVYVGSSQSGAVATFDRAADGTLTQKPGTGGCTTFAVAPPCAHSDVLGGVRALAISPDGTTVYAAAATSGAVVVFDRAPNGALSQTVCANTTGTFTCSLADRIGNARGIAVSPDGRNVYVSSYSESGDPSGVAVLSWDAATGTLSQSPTTAGCIAEGGTPADPACAVGTGLIGTWAVAVSPDGANVYASTGNGVAVFDRRAGGALVQQPLPDGCVEDPAGPRALGCGKADGVLSARAIAVAPDGGAVYTASPLLGAVAALARDAAPVCHDVARTAFNATAREIALDCSDANGDALTYAIAGAPAHGTLGAAGATVVYTPAPGFAGTDTFSYRASARGAQSNLATVTVEVLPPAPVGGPPSVVNVAGGAKATLVAALRNHALKVKRGRAFSVGYLATARGTATLELLKGHKRVLSATGVAKASRTNTIAVATRRLARGRYTLRLTVRGADGQTARDAGKLTVR